MCILGEMLRVPMITLNYEPNLFCNHMFSMRPDPSIMNQALVAMVRELRPRIVAVVTEGTLFFVTIMSIRILSPESLKFKSHFRVMHG